MMKVDERRRIGERPERERRINISLFTRLVRVSVRVCAETLHKKEPPPMTALDRINGPAPSLALDFIGVLLDSNVYPSKKENN